MKNNWIGFLLCGVAFIIMACSVTDLFSKLKGSNSDSSTTNNEDSSESYRSEEGGFEFRQLDGYEITEYFGMVQMLPPGANQMTGPMIMLLGGLNDDEMDNETLLEKMSEDTPEADFSKPKKIKVDGKNGFIVELTSTYEGESLEGRMVVVMVTPNQQFVLLGAAPKGEWKTVNRDFEKVLDSINFFDATPVSPVLEEPEGSITEVPTSTYEVNSDGMLRQWASSAVASSEYGSNDWSAMQAVGEPDVDECGDDSRAWASESANTVEWIELSYDVPVIPYEITIIQSYNPSQIIDVTGITEDGKEYLILEAETEYVDYCPDYWTITIEPENEAYIKTLRITIDQSVLGLGWNEIDAVQMVGIPQGGVINSQSNLQSSGGSSTTSSGGGNAPYLPEELDPGSFSYSISGYENDVVMGADLQYQSINPEYVIGMISGDMRYGVSLFLPKNELSKGSIIMKPYDANLSTKGPTAAIYINTFLYMAENGEYFFENDPNTGTITGTFYFTARSKDFPDRLVEVSGSMNQVELK